MDPDTSKGLNSPDKIYCNSCDRTFTPSQNELDFIYKISPVFEDEKIPFQHCGLCPHCRRQNRHALRNQFRLFKRRCDLSGRSMLSIHTPDAPFPVFHHELWWEKKRRGLDFGRDFDFSKTFFEQMQELRNEVPVESLRLVNCENSEYCSNSVKCKNCLMVFGSTECEDCFYLENCSFCKNTMLAWRSTHLELCYGIYGSDRLFNCFHSEACYSSSDLYFCKQCYDCAHCFGCSQLHHKKYHIYNRPYSKQEYLTFMSSFNSGSFKEVEEHREKARQFWKTVPVSPLAGGLNENCFGDNVFESKNCKYAFSAKNCEDSKYIFETVAVNQSMDLDNVRYASGLCYQDSHCQTIFHVCFSYNSHNCSDSFYISDCIELKHCFGCIGLYNEHHCILNKRYSAEEYYKLAKKIAHHMQETGEWGQQFPRNFSRFGYKHTTAYVHYPLEKEDALEDGFNWSDFEEPFRCFAGAINSKELPDDINNTDNDIVKYPIICQQTGRPFRIQRKELNLLRKLKVPLPRYYYTRQFQPIRKGRNPIHIYKTRCKAKKTNQEVCSELVKTTYPPSSNQVIYCDSCHQKYVF